MNKCKFLIKTLSSAGPIDLFGFDQFCKLTNKECYKVDIYNCKEFEKENGRKNKINRDRRESN